MKQILHRQNDDRALYLSITSDPEGFFSRWAGVEIDVLPAVTSRERTNLQLFVAHDQLSRIGRTGKPSAPTLGAWWAMLRSTLKQLGHREVFYLFIDIKASNICAQLSELIKQMCAADRAVGVRVAPVLFDIPGPDLREYDALGVTIPYAGRVSEYELQKSGGYTVFDLMNIGSRPQSLRLTLALEDAHKSVFIDPSLHGREHAWPAYAEDFASIRWPDFLITKQYRDVSVAKEKAA